jgi:spermidine synthase
MCHGKQAYKGKEVLILGGGDGALLHELLKEKPKFVTMVDIDEAVIRGCKEHMRSACGTVLDKMETDQYKIIVDDACKWLKTYKEEKKQFDIIFGDLTDIPVHEGGDTWEFVRTVVKAALSLLPVGGKYYTHCNGVSAKSAVQYFEKMLNSIGVPIEIEQTQAHVPSFCEKWIFYQLTRKEGAITEDVNGDAAVAEDDKKVEAPVSNGTDKKETKEEEKTEPAKEEKKEEAKKEKASPEKKDDKKGGAKDLKDKLEVSKEKGLTKEKSTVDKKVKKAK